MVLHERESGGRDEGGDIFPLLEKLDDMGGGGGGMRAGAEVDGLNGAMFQIIGG